MKIVPSSAGETILVENRVVRRRSAALRDVIACLGCQWLKAENDDVQCNICGKTIAECTGMGPGTVYPILDRLEEGGVIVRESRETGYHNRDIFPTVSDVGDAFYAVLVVPDDCGLEG